MPCELCELVKRVEQGIEEPLYQDNLFVLVYCKTHTDTPMAVLLRHSSTATEAELEHIKGIIHENYPDRKPRGTGMTQIKDHWHEHFVKD